MCEPVGSVRRSPSPRVHAYKYGEVPPEAVQVNVMLWPRSAAGGLALTDALNESIGVGSGPARSALRSRPGWRIADSGPLHAGTRARASNTARAAMLPARARGAMSIIPDDSKPEGTY